MPVSKKRKPRKTTPPKRRSPQREPPPVSGEFDDDDMIYVRSGRHTPSTVVVPGPGNRAGFTDGEYTWVPNAVIHDARLGPSAPVVYGRLLVERPPFQATWDELTASVLAFERHPDDSAEETVAGLEQLRTHGYLVPCESGW